MSSTNAPQSGHWPRRDIETAMFDADYDDADYGDLADAVIAHLWSRADDPEVVEAVAKQLYRDTLRTSEFLVLPDGMSAWEVLPTQIKNEWKAMVRSTRASLLTALLGPRPNGEEAADER